jgi:hypothetical protein
LRTEDVAMDESICNIQISKDSNVFLVKVQTEVGGLREYKSKSFEELLQQLIIDLQEEFESVP